MIRSLWFFAGESGLQIVLGLAVGYGLLRLLRWIREQSPVCGAIVAAGFLSRAALGMFFFWSSYLDWRLVDGLHFSNGFWVFAPDAQGYFRRAARVAQDGLQMVAGGSASPTYVKSLAIWIRIVGESPASGMFLNLAAYTLACGLLTYLLAPRTNNQARLPGVLLLGAYSLSPVLIIHGTQPLKNSVFAFLLVVAGAGAYLLLASVVHGLPARQPPWVPISGLVLLMAALWALAGIRSYYPFMLCMGLAFSLFVFIFWQRSVPLARYLAVAATVISLSFAATYQGGGLYASTYATAAINGITGGPGDDQPTTSFPSPMSVLREIGRHLERHRRGFVASGGRTNIITFSEHLALQEDPLMVPADGPVFARAQADDWTEYARRLLIGVAAISFPISLLRALSIVDFPGGRGFLFFTDIDTALLGLTALGVSVLIYRRRRLTSRDLPFIFFSAMLVVATALLLGYVVTNFGTLVRLRLMILVPLSLLALTAAGGHLGRRDDLKQSKRSPSHGA